MSTKTPSSKNLTQRKIHSRLIERGYSFRSWALKNDFNPRTVRATVERWAGKGRQPHGVIARKILHKLDATIFEVTTE